MRNTYIFLALLSVVIVGVLVAVFSIVGSPVSQNLIAYDKTRLSDFSSIKYAMDNYYTTNQKLPTALSELPMTVHTKDPQTSKTYTYTPQTTSQYKLCTEFSTDSTNQDSYLLNPSGTKPLAYKKGYQCLDYELSSYVLQNAQYTFPTPTATIPIQ